MIIGCLRLNVKYPKCNYFSLEINNLLEFLSAIIVLYKYLNSLIVHVLLLMCKLSKQSIYIYIYIRYIS